MVCVVLAAGPDRLGVRDERPYSHAPPAQSPPRRSEVVDAQVQPAEAHLPLWEAAHRQAR